MEAAEVVRAVDAVKVIASSLDLAVDDVSFLHNSNKLALRLLPCDVMARVAPANEQNAQFEIDLAQQLVELGSPMAALEPRVEPLAYERDGFVVTFWTYYESVAPDPIAPADYADALERLHAGMCKVDLPSPHFTDRIAEAQELVANRHIRRGRRHRAVDSYLLLDPVACPIVEEAVGRRGAARRILPGG